MTSTIKLTISQMVYLAELVQVKQIAFHRKTGALALSNRMCLNQTIDELREKLDKVIAEVKEEDEMLTELSKHFSGVSVSEPSKKKQKEQSEDIELKE